jgi:AcrR family transcriptional regulator
MTTKGRAPHRRSTESHQAVLEAAQVLLEEIGYSSITVDQIAERAGVSKATVYRWWPNKAAVFMELYGVLGQVEGSQPADTGSLEGDLREQIRGAFRLFRRTVAGVALAGFVADAQWNPQSSRLLREDFARRRRALNLAVLERARARGELASHVCLDTAADVITGAVYYPVLIGEHDYSNAHADRIVEVVLRGLGAAPTRTGSSTAVRSRRRTTDS